MVAVRFYTTFAFSYMNKPLRDDERYASDQPCPLPVATYFAVEGIKKLRALRVEAERYDLTDNTCLARPRNAFRGWMQEEV